MLVARPVLAAVLAASAVLSAQAPAPLPIPDVPPASTLPPVNSAPTGLPSGAPFAGLTIAIDPGHGGEDPGVQAGGRTEAALVLPIARRVAAALTAQGAHVVLTREVDVALDADARAVRANQAHAHLYLSLHLNRSPRVAAAGAEVYSHTAMTDGSGARGQTLTRWHQVQDRHVAASEQLADLLATALNGRVPVATTPHQRAPLRLLAGLDMPAVLVELAYLSNPDQLTLAETPDFQAAVADAVVEALLKARQLDGAR